MTLCLFEDADVAHLAPLALTRGAFDLVVGARTLGATAAAAFPHDRLALHTREALAGMAAEEHPDAFVRALPDTGGTLFVNARWRVTDGDVADAVRTATTDRVARAFVQDDTLLALWDPAPTGRRVHVETVGLEAADGIAREAVDGQTVVSRLWHLIDDLPARIASDLRALGGLGAHDGATVQDGARLVAPGTIHLGTGATVRAGAVLNAADGPVHVGAGATVEENAVVRGPCLVGPRSRVKAGACVDGSAVGFWSKVGGEVHESILHSLSSKPHGGYLGHAALGRWCNLGAGTETSNLRNDYGPVSAYDAVAGEVVSTGRQFLGLVMGDHSKCAVGTTFNTGTVVGVFCNLFGAGFPPRYVPSFSWGGAAGLQPYRIDKALRVAEAVLARRDRTLSAAERERLTALAAS